MLADAGWSVLVLESQDEPGGAVRSGELTVPGQVCDLFSAFYPLAAASPALRGLGLERHGLRWRNAPAVLAHPLPDGRCAVLHRSPEATARSVDDFAPGDGAAWLRMYEEWQRVGPHVLAALFRPVPPVTPTLRLARALGAGGGVRFARRSLLPVLRLGEEWFRGEGARLLLTGCALHTDLAPGEAGSGAYGWLLAMLGQQFGFPVPEGGAGRLTDALVARLRAAGGQLVCGVHVNRILVHEGRVDGVATTEGETVGVARAVLADVTAPSLYRDLIGRQQLPARLIADLERFQWDRPTLKIDWALSAPVPWSSAGTREAGTVHLGAGTSALAGYAAQLAAGAMPRRPYLVMGQMTTADPTRSPPGTESAWAYTHLPHGTPTSRALARHVERIEDTLERHAPGFRDLVVARRIAGPEQLEADDASLVGGATTGGTAALHQQLIFRPTPGLGRSETVIDGLYLASSSAHPGGGVHGACGANAARAALARYRPGGRIYAAGMLGLTRHLQGDAPGGRPAKGRLRGPTSRQGLRARPP
ncbi:MAG: phytoene desaturase family protein [Carbonactinosporaceae bacterium]